MLLAACSEILLFLWPPNKEGRQAWLFTCTPKEPPSSLAKMNTIQAYTILQALCTTLGDRIGVSRSHGSESLSWGESVGGTAQ